MTTLRSGLCCRNSVCLSVVCRLSVCLQGRPVNVKHDARCVMGKVGGKDKRPKQAGFLKYYITVFVTIKCSKTHVQPFVLFVICYYLVVTGHCCESMTHRPGFYPGMFWVKFFPQKNLKLPPRIFATSVITTLILKLKVTLSTQRDLLSVI